MPLDTIYLVRHGGESGWHFDGEASFDTSTTMAKAVDGNVLATVTTAVVV
ncbi:hypothetical protein BJX64DRAFT_290384 [Aspergillus heterothallicus]